MPEYLSPGVYVEEFSIGPKPVEGVSTSTAGFVGIAEKGPLNKPELVTSMSEFRDKFGNYYAKSFLAYAVAGFFENGGKRCYVVRVAGPEAKAASMAKQNRNGPPTYTLTISAKSEGDWGNDLKVEIDEASSGNSVMYHSELKNDISLNSISFKPESTEGLSREDTIIITNGGHTEYFNIVKIFEGEVFVNGEIKFNFFKSNTQVFVTIATGKTSVTLKNVLGFENGGIVSFLTGNNQKYTTEIKNVSISDKKLTIGAFSNEIKAQELIDIKRKEVNFSIIGILTKGADIIPLSQITGSEKEKIKSGDILILKTGLVKDFYRVINIVPGTSTLTVEPNLSDSYVGEFSVLFTPKTEIFNTLIDQTTFDTTKKLLKKSTITGLHKGDKLQFSSQNGQNPKIFQISDVTEEGYAIDTFVNSNYTQIKFFFSHDSNSVVVKDAQDFAKEDLIKIVSGSNSKILRVQTIDDNRITFYTNIDIDITSADLSAQEWKETVVQAVDFGIRIKNEKEDFVEYFPKLSMNKNSSRYVAREGVINGVSKLVSIEVEGDVGGSYEVNDLPPVTQMASMTTKIGTDDLGNIKIAQFIGVDKGKGDRTGLTAFEAVDEINILCLPDMMLSNQEKTGSYFGKDQISGLQGKMISHCERLKDRFAILDSLRNYDITEIQNWKVDHFDSQYAALYYPWIRVLDPIQVDGCSTRLIPPCGHIAGIYARSDIERGVHKAPANEVINGVTELEFDVTSGQQDILNPSGINCLRKLPGRGIRVWGSRTLSSDPLWKYVNVRRLFIYLEESINKATQWVVFEPNDIPLWARVRQTIDQFLTDSWQSGMLAGASPSQAFFVKCDRTTMSQNDIDNGKLVCVIGVAPVKPAEFVIFRLAQWTLGAK
jgi:phage tail sheath protein FI